MYEVNVGFELCDRSIYLVLNIRLLTFVQVNFYQLRSVQLFSDSFTHYLHRVNQVFQKCIVDGGKRAAGIVN